MRAWTLAFLLGVTSILFLQHLPSIGCALILLSSCLATLIFTPKKYLPYIALPIAALFGFSWAVLHADQILAVQLPKNLENQQLTVLGTVASLPENKNNYTSFILAIKSINKTIQYNDPLLTRLVWEQAPWQLHVGDEWQLTVKLKRPRGFWNVGGFDYQQWLFAQRIRATGYVVNNTVHTFVGVTPIIYSVDRMRQRLADQINKQLANNSNLGLITALAVGVRDNITDNQWLVLRNTGTNHLFAIAGLHIGIVTSAIFIMVGFFWSRIRRLALYIPAQQIAAIAALLTAIFYSALAGFSLPTQRAIIMTAVFLCSILLRRNLLTWTAWSLALLILVITEPLTILDNSFWLSFVAVGFIIYGVNSQTPQKKSWWWHWTRAQWVMAIGLIPLSLLFFQQTSLASFIANIIAVPWVGFIVLPLVLLGDIFWFVAPILSVYFWQLAAKALQILWPVLCHLALIDQLQWQTVITHLWILIAAQVSVILLLLPKKYKLRYLGVLGFLPLIFCQQKTPAPNQVWFTLLDVGQNLAAVVRTQHHTLIYTAGLKSSNFDNTVITSFLQYSGVKKTDMIIDEHHSYYINQQWRWDGINFQVLYPPQNTINSNNFCVLRISINQQSILLTGDIDQKPEKDLIKNSANNLASTILIAPHHGSAANSCIEFINAVHPHFVLFSTDYLNRYGYPDPQVVAAYHAMGAITYNTADVGEIDFKLTGHGNIAQPETYLQNHWKFWDE